MTTIPVVALLLATVALGVYLGFLYLSRVRRPVLIGFHLLMGIGGLEMLVYLMREADDMRQGIWAAGLVALALFLGLLAPLIVKTTRIGAEALLAIHALVGIAGFLVCLSWVKGL